MNQNGNAQAEQPPADPGLVKILQYYLELAHKGQLVGVAIVGVDRAGTVYTQPAVPQNPQLIHLFMGAVTSLNIKLDGMLAQFLQQMKPSPIIKPPPGMHP
jgi:hypothetical protein